MKRTLIAVSVLLSLSACSDGPSEKTIEKLVKVTAELNKSLDRAEVLLPQVDRSVNQLTIIVDSSEKHIKKMNQASVDISTTLSSISTLKYELINIESDLNTTNKEQQKHLSELYWSDINLQIADKGGFIAFYGSSPQNKLSFNNFLSTKSISIMSGGRLGLGWNEAPILNKAPVSKGYLDDFDNNYLYSFRKFAMGYGKNPTLLKSACEQWCSKFFIFATDEQKDVFKGFVNKYATLLKISQKTDFQTLAKAIIDTETQYNTDSKEAVNAREALVQSFSEYSLYELQAAYRHFTNSYKAWNELITVAKKHIV